MGEIFIIIQMQSEHSSSLKAGSTKNKNNLTKPGMNAQLR
jgi:hypothetical protein